MFVLFIRMHTLTSSSSSFIYIYLCLRLLPLDLKLTCETWELSMCFAFWRIISLSFSFHFHPFSSHSIVWLCLPSLFCAVFDTHHIPSFTHPSMLIQFRFQKWINKFSFLTHLNSTLLNLYFHRLFIFHRELKMRSVHQRYCCEWKM